MKLTISSLFLLILVTVALADFLPRQVPSPQQPQQVPAPQQPQQPPQCPVCPSCFNCLLGDNPCNNGGLCDSKGLCQCPPGFSGRDCSDVVCGSLANQNRTPKPANATCTCDDGWTGGVCNVCQTNNACIPLKGQNATCVKNSRLVKEFSTWCTVSNIPLVSNAQTSLHCSRSTSRCDFQLWINNEINMYCRMANCTHNLPSAAETFGKCENVECGCMKSTTLCGMLSSTISNIKGPAEYRCDPSGTDCNFLEYSTLKSLFSKGLNMKCNSGECVNPQDLLDVASTEPKSFPVGSAVGIAIGAAAALVLLILLVRYFLNRHRHYLSDDSYAADEINELGASLFTDQKGSTLAFERVEYTVGGKRILSDISGIVRPGELCAIMGPSGAGKSSLLDILAFRRKRGEVSGHVWINGTVPSRKQLRRTIGYVDQESALMGTLTVRETLMFTAMLRLPREMPLAAKKHRVKLVMDELGLTEIADCQIGVPGRRGISGGEKRRVSIAQELVTSPSLLFLDEPTSGLDAYNAYTVMNSLKKLAKQHGRTVVVAIHQPRSSIFNMFDSLLLLSGGCTVFCGPAPKVAEYFRSIGYTAPPDYNIADYFIDLTMENTVARKPASPLERFSLTHPFRRRQKYPESTEASHHEMHRIVPVSSEESNRAEVTEFLNNQSDALINHYARSEYAAAVNEELARAKGENIENEKALSPSTSHPSAGQSPDISQKPLLKDYKDEPASMGRFFQELGVLSIRSFTNLYRNPFLFFAHFTVALLLGLLIGLLFWKVSDDLSGFQNRLGSIFFMCALLAFGSLSSLDLFSQERSLFVREREAGYYGSMPYFLAKILFDLIPLRVIPALILGAISYYMIGLQPAPDAFGRFLGALLLFNLVAAAVCLVIAALCRNVAIGNLIGSLIMLFAMLFGGFLLNKDVTPKWLGWLQYLSFFNYGFEAMIVNEMSGLMLRDKGFGGFQIPSDAILTRFGFNPDAYMRDILVLVGLLVGLLIIAYVCLRVFVRERR
ncbi:uncharacterized protein VTP21DRAFT_8287 [Calcarisporiella thermophila]|uniref:uncharacterized protein n=1 Tax=Calcarisporiella thermophila TaxID=911321 RepID=UPI003741F4D1